MKETPGGRLEEQLNPVNIDSEFDAEAIWSSIVAAPSALDTSKWYTVLWMLLQAAAQPIRILISYVRSGLILSQ